MAAITTTDKIDRLNGENYRTWKFAIKMLLIQRELWPYVDNSITLKRDATPAEEQAHKAKVDKALSTIALSIDPDQQIHIVDCNTAIEAWQALEQVYEPKSRQRIMQLKREFVRIRLREDESMESYLSRMKICYNYLQTAGSEMKDEDLAYAMLTGLPESYDALTMTLASLSDERFKSAEIKQSLLMEYERRQSKDEEKHVSKDIVAYQINKGKQQNVSWNTNNNKCFNCGKPGHYANKCRSKRTNVKHYNKFRGRDATALLMEIHHVNIDEAWLIDSAATHHVCRNREWFRNFKEISPEPIGTAENKVRINDGTMTANGIGNILLRTNYNMVREDLIVENVYYVPKCKRNLLSVAQIEKNGRSVKFENGKAWITDVEKKETLMKARRIDNLYVAQVDVIDTVNERKIKLHSMTMNDLNVWHKRFCHVNTKSIEELAKKGFVEGLDNTKSETEKCPGCCMGKSTKAHCKGLEYRQSKGILELIHTDLCGPMPVKSIGGCKYFMTLIDDYSRKMEVVFLENKDEVTKHIQSYIARVEREKDVKVKRIRTDNGLEYCNQNLKRYFDQLGIKHERSCVETPQMNGIAERANRTLLDLVRSMLQTAKLPQSFWAEATKTAAYIRNRMLHSSIKDGVPEGIWNNRIPSVRHLKAFGCLAYVHLPAQGRKKLDARARECILVGYANQTKGYRLWDPNRKNITETKHVRFDEHKIGYEYVYKRTEQVYFEIPENERIEVDEIKETELEKRENEVKDIKSRQELIKSTHIDLTQTEDEDEVDEELNNEDADENVPRTVGVTEEQQERQSQRIGRKKKIPRNPYGRKGKPKENMELNLLEIFEPTNLQEALESPQATEWKEAINEEIHNLKRLKTWEEVSRVPDNKTCIGHKWVFKVKPDSEGNILRYKARLVAQGFNQREGTDYNLTYAPVVRFGIVRFLLALTCQFGWKTRHIDVKSAYLNGRLDEDIYMKIPTLDVKEEDRFAKLLRPLYGLKQSGRNWNNELDGFLITKGFERLNSSNCTYRREYCAFVITYVDDIVIFSREEKTIDEIVELIGKQYEIRDLGEISFFLGVKIEHEETGSITLNQSSYISSLLQKYAMVECRTALTPLEPGIILTKEDSPKSDEERRLMIGVPYRELIGSLMYIAQHTRPDISFAVTKLAQYASNPGRIHWNQAKRILRYLSNTRDYKLKYVTDELKINIWSDADWGSDIDDRKSYSGTIVTIGKNLVDWKASKQKCISTSTMEAEYIALSSAAKEAKWTQVFVKELGIEYWLSLPYTIFSDNRAAIDFARNRIERSRTKHIDIAYHNVREMIDNGIIVIEYVQSDHNLADGLTKTLKRVRLEMFVKISNLYPG